MKYLLASLLSIALFNIHSFSQVGSQTNQIDQDKENYEKKVFNKELDESQDWTNEDRKMYDRIPEKLPNWVFNPLDFTNPAKIVGFSDPNMTREEAYQQAVLRAKAVYALLKLSAISNITDDYTNLKESGSYALYSTKFQDFTLSKSKLVYNDSTIVVADTFFTKYNEGIVLIEINDAENSAQNKDTLTVKGEHLQVFMERNFRREKIEFFNFSIQDHVAKHDSLSLMAQYNYKRVNRGFDISSIYGDKSIEFKERTYNYRTELEFKKDSTDTEYNLFRLNKGLWNAYITGVLSNFTMLSKQLSAQIKNSNDFYTLKNQGLIRTVSRNKVSFDSNRFKIYENQFLIDLNGLIIQ